MTKFENFPRVHSKCKITELGMFIYEYEISDVRYKLTFAAFGL